MCNCICSMFTSCTGFEILAFSICVKKKNIRKNPALNKKNKTRNFKNILSKTPLFKNFINTKKSKNNSRKSRNSVANLLQVLKGKNQWPVIQLTTSESRCIPKLNFRAIVFSCIHVNNFSNNIASKVKAFVNDTSLFSVVYDSKISTKNLITT